MTALSRRVLLTGAAATAGALAMQPGAALAAAGAPAEQAFAPNPARLRQTLDYAVAKLRQTAPTVATFPEETKFEKWIPVNDGGWVGGFWPGLLWLGFVDSRDPQFEKWAREAALRLTPRIPDTGTHDMGFLFYPSWVTAYRLTGEAAWRDGAVRAAESLSKRYNTAGKFIRAWGSLGSTGNAGRTIIDTMMNLDLMFWATEVTGDGKYADIAANHARTTIKHFIRPDGSTPHVFDFDPVSGTAVGPNTVQGYSPTSTWARGQAWGIYGFATTYRRTGDRQFLNAATRMADHILPYLAESPVPIWDYRSPLAPHDIRDSSAGAITACGLLDLAKITGNARYQTTALTVLDALSRTCLTTRSDRHDAVLARGTKNRRAENGIEVSLPYGDYYLMEAILRVLKPREIAKAIGL
ncbi:MULTISPECIES: glycoside hydrolase family 88 protein [unclassified Crossiella]|uniref:glycoside hydrolase family 88 protein n=1 Tax=unclassified Crossiella TaxID=2620835 RepID=UPI001FFF203E|nr:MULTISPECIES: glycoside hydrolase family 88 protein [unclassified Crossiella]MCK2237692.1 glycoside hydrolase family 88 protein [Crossiella sp. S99.2]MCK2254978.1 glycoside hydrolase family 88 protein [Crossiella sp. S99.1]